MDPASDVTLTATTTAVPTVGYDLLTPLISTLFGQGTLETLLPTTIAVVSTLWTVYVVLAYLVAGGLLWLYVYASIRKGQLEELQDEMIAEAERLYNERYRTGPRHDRLADVMTHIATDNPNDWKLAIIEADIILDDALKRAGYAGASLGERLRALTTAQLASLDDAWQAHKVRNQVAHGGADFVLTKRLAEDTIKLYRRVFDELGVT
jgi:hypothetical protein